MRGLWAIMKQESSHSGIAGLEEWSRAFPKEFAEKTGINFEALLNSLGGEFGMVLTLDDTRKVSLPLPTPRPLEIPEPHLALVVKDRKSTRLNSSHQIISYAVFCLKKKKKKTTRDIA